MNIKVIGSHCSNGIKLKKVLNRVNEIFNNDIDIEYKDLPKDFHKYNVKNKPALIINGVMVSEGKVISDREIINYLKLCNE